MLDGRAAPQAENPESVKHFGTTSARKLVSRTGSESVKHFETW
jgi:hypothetical protein